MRDRSLYVQYGCGLCAPATWRNFDSSNSLRLKRHALLGPLLSAMGKLTGWPSNVEYGDITRGLPIPLGSSRGIYCSHVLEHLSLDDLRRALVNTHNYLAHGGVFRLVMPDLHHLAEEYLSNRNADAAVRFMHLSGLGHRQPTRGVVAALRSAYASSRHLWLWDYDSIASELARVGFSNIRRAQYSDAADPRFLDVEDEARWHEALGVECIKYG